MLVPLLAVAAASLATAAGHAAPPRDGTYVGTTGEHRKIRVVVAGGEVARAMTTAGAYVCRPEGAVGPLTVKVRPHAPVVDRAVRFDAGPTTAKLRMAATFPTRTTLRGTVRVHGTIGTGDPCTSPVRRFTAKLRR